MPELLGELHAALCWGRRIAGAQSTGLVMLVSSDGLDAGRCRDRDAGIAAAGMAAL